MYLFVLELNDTSIKRLTREKMVEEWGRRWGEFQAHMRTPLLMRSPLLKSPSPCFIFSLDNRPTTQTLLLVRVSPV